MANHKQNTDLLSIADAQKQFQSWRAAKAPGETIPDRLWKTVAGLLENTSYKRSHISNALGISGKQMRNQFPAQIKSKPAGAAAALKNTGVFVEAPLRDLCGVPTLTQQFIIERSNGAKLIFPSVTQEQFSLLIKTFME